MATGTTKRVIEIDAKIGAQTLAELRGLRESLKGVEDSSRTTAKSVSDFSTSLGGIKGQAAVFGLVANGFNSIKTAALGVVDAVKDTTLGILETQKSAEQLRNGFAAIRGGDIAAAGRDIEYVRKAAADLNLDFQGATKTYLQLVAATKGTSLEGSGVQRVFEAVSGASQKLGLSTETTGRAITALQQILSKGKVQQEEFRGQLGEALPVALGVASRAFGVTTQQLNEMIAAGLDGTEFVTRFSDQLAKEFGGKAAEGANTATAALAKFTSQYDQLKVAFAETGASARAAEQLNHVSDIFQNITKRIQEARKEGAGFFGQIGAGIAGSVEGFGKDGFSYVYKDRDARIKQLQSLNDGKGPSATRGQGIAQVQELKELLKVQKQVQAETDALKAPDDYAEGTSSGLDKIRESYRQLNGEYSKNDTARKKELADLDRAKEFLPEVAANYDNLKKKIIEKYKETDKDGDAYKRSKQSADEFLRTLSDQIATYSDVTEAGNQHSASLAREAEGLKRATQLRGKDATEFRAQLSEEIKQLHDAENARVAYQASLRSDADLRKTIESIDEENEKLRESIAQYSGKKVAVDDLKQAQIDQQIVQLQGELDSGNSGYVDQIQSEIDKLREQKKLIQDNGKARKESEDADKDKKRKESEAESFQRILETSITNGVKGGKGFGADLITSLKDSLESQAIKILIEPETKAVSEELQRLADEGRKLFKTLFDELVKANSNGQGLSGLFSDLFSGSGQGGSSGGGLGSLFGSLFGSSSSGGSSGSSDVSEYAQYAQIAASFFAAKGAVMQDGMPTKFASGGVFNTPTKFAMGGGGTGLLGEAGPEAIMPLTRGADGKLGVKTSGAADTTGGGVIVNITNTTDSQVTAREQKNDNGQKQIEILVTQLVQKGIAQGSFDKSMRSTYGLGRKGV